MPKETLTVTDNRTGRTYEIPTVLFAIPRTSGWLAQWEEMLLDPEQKITRPRQVFIGHTRRDLPIAKVTTSSKATA